MRRNLAPTPLFPATSGASAVRRLIVLLTLLALIATALPVAAHPGHGDAKGWKARPATFDVLRVQDVRITMSDGVRLAADIYFPAKDGKRVGGRLPAILTQTPYNKNSGALAFHSEYLVSRGYVQVIADVRGTGSSPGTWDSFGTREQRDGAELVRWIARQPWSNKRVGLHGTSYGAINQIFTARRQPRALKAAFPVVPMADSYRDIVNSGGQVNTSFIPLWLGLVTSLGLVPPTYSGDDPVGAAHALTSHVGNLGAFQAPAVANSTTGGPNAYDNAFSRQRSPIQFIDDVEVPTFIVGGWFDLFQRGEPLLYERLRDNGVPTRLLMGPWYHTNVGDGLPANGVPTLDELELRWFDRYVRGIADPAMDHDIKPVTYFNMGEERYRTAQAWPPRGTDPQTLYVSGSASPGSPGTLSATPPKQASTSAVPWHPLSGACSRSTAQWTATGAPTCTDDQRFNDNSGVVFDLPVKRNLQLLGPVAAKLFVSTTGRDAALSVRLEDVAPDGSVVQLSQGWQVVSLRKLQRHRDTLRVDGTMLRPYHPFTRKSVLPVEGDKVYPTWVEIFPTGALVKKGHTLRLSVQPSDTPHLAPPLPQAANLAGGVTTIHHGGKYPSAVMLPAQG